MWTVAVGFGDGSTVVIFARSFNSLSCPRGARCTKLWFKYFWDKALFTSVLGSLERCTFGIWLRGSRQNDCFTRYEKKIIYIYIEKRIVGKIDMPNRTANAQRSTQHIEWLKSGTAARADTFEGFVGGAG